MDIFTKMMETSNHSKALKSQGKKLGFVPTMGALHDGHLSLIETAKKHSDSVIVSIFVNPTQFAENEDFGDYPRVLEKDLELLKNIGCDAVFTPTEEEIYPEGKPEAKNIVKNNADILCGKSRPHFFHGVWLVVSRLFRIVEPVSAVFGEKDFQQLHIIRQMAKLEELDIDIIGAPIVREKSGLAMSSRNKYLSQEQLKIASNLFIEMSKVEKNLSKGENFTQTIQNAKDNLIVNGFDNIDYLEVRDSETLEELNEYKKGARIFAAAFSGKTRLIDNYEI